MKDHLLISDIDNTMLGDDEAMSRFTQWRTNEGQGLRLAYATGRFFEAVADLVKQSGLPAPEAVIGGVGSDIRRFPSGEYVKEWHERIGPNWNGNAVREHVSQLPYVELQPPDCQSAFKASFYVQDATPRQRDEIGEVLKTIGVDGHIIYSSNRDLDILPAKANKGTASAFLAELWSIPHDRVFVSGDSGNDLALFEQGFHGIVVANARDELKDLDGERVYHAERPYAGGVLEGIRYWLERENPGGDGD